MHNVAHDVVDGAGVNIDELIELVASNAAAELTALAELKKLVKEIEVAPINERGESSLRK